MIDKVTINEFWEVKKHGPRNFTATRNDGEGRFYFSRDVLEQDFGKIIFPSETCKKEAP